MKTKLLVILPVTVVVLFSACNNGTRPDSSLASAEQAAATDTTGVSTLGAVAPLNDPSRKIIRTAALRCRVKDVLSATTAIEQDVRAAGGVVMQSDTRNDATGMQRLPYGNDSLIQVQSYTTTAALTLKIPVAQLDTVLNAIAGSAAFIDNRQLKLDDVSLQYLTNQLKEKAARKTDNNRPSELARRTADVIVGNEYADEKNEASIERSVANLNIREQVTYATLQLELYQPERVDRLMIPDTGELMKAPFGLQLRNSFAGGWTLFLDLMLLLVRLWPLLLFALGGWILYRGRKMKPKYPGPATANA